jgi:hypothetical protein
MSVNKNLSIQDIYEIYKNIEFNKDNYFIGGGISEDKFVSKRQQEANEDLGKLTLGETIKLFQKASKLDKKTIRNIIEFAIPKMEWHHSGKLRNGKMGKTYFVNSFEISEIAKNWDFYINKINYDKKKSNI